MRAEGKKGENFLQANQLYINYFAYTKIQHYFLKHKTKLLANYVLQVSVALSHTLAIPLHQLFSCDLLALWCFLLQGGVP